MAKTDVICSSCAAGGDCVIDEFRQYVDAIVADVEWRKPNNDGERMVILKQYIYRLRYGEGNA